MGLRLGGGRCARAVDYGGRWGDHGSVGVAVSVLCSNTTPAFYVLHRSGTGCVRVVRAEELALPGPWLFLAWD